MTAHETRRVAVGRTRSTIGQVIAGILGLALVIAGGVAIARVGFDSLTGDTANVLCIDHTLALGLIDVVVGLIFLSAASATFGVLGTLLSMGTMAVAFGAIVLIEPDPFVDFLGSGTPVGVLYLLVGIVSLIGGFATPNYVREEIREETNVDGAIEEDRIQTEEF